MFIFRSRDGAIHYCNQRFEARLFMKSLNFCPILKIYYFRGAYFNWISTCHWTNGCNTTCLSGLLQNYWWKSQVSKFNTLVYRFSASSYNYSTILCLLKAENEWQEIKDEYYHCHCMTTWVLEWWWGWVFFLFHRDSNPGWQDESWVPWPLIHCPHIHADDPITKVN